MKEQAFVNLMADLIAVETDFARDRKRGLPPTLARAANNPGLLAYWEDRRNAPMETLCGAVVFENERDGWQALQRKIRTGLVNRAFTLEQFFLNLWARPKTDENDMILVGYSGRPVFESGARGLQINPAQIARRIAEKLRGPLDASVDVSTQVAQFVEKEVAHGSARRRR